MAKIKEAVFDAGPFIHLEEVDGFKLLNLIFKILTTKEVALECRGIPVAKFATIVQLRAQSKDFAKYILERYDIHLGEATAIALCKQEQIKLFFTDDLDARGIAKLFGFQAHGSIAIILRCYRENMLTKKQAKRKIEQLYHDSSLFFTKDLFDWTIKEIDAFKRN